MGHHHEIAVRYGEVDLQRVVFNAHYLAYVDDAMDHWMRELDAEFEAFGWDYMLKRAEVDWHGAAGLGDLIQIESEIARWGTTSFVIDHQLHVGERRVVSVLVTYVGVEAGTVMTMAAPGRVRAHLGEPSGGGA